MQDPLDGGRDSWWRKKPLVEVLRVK